MNHDVMVNYFILKLWSYLFGLAPLNDYGWVLRNKDKQIYADIDYFYLRQ